MWCWWCCHEPPGEFIHMPIKQHKISRKFVTVGNFCSWECMKAYALEKYGTHAGGIICMHMRSMREDKRIIRAAPPRIILKQFGGTMDIDEFRKKLDTSIRVAIPDMEHKLYQIVEQVKPATHSVGGDDSKMNSIMSSNCDDDSLRLKRTKPLKRDAKNNLENSLGLSIKKHSTLPGGGL